MHRTNIEQMHRTKHGEISRWNLMLEDSNPNENERLEPVDTNDPTKTKCRLCWSNNQNLPTLVRRLGKNFIAAFFWTTSYNFWKTDTRQDQNVEQLRQRQNSLIESITLEPTTKGLDNHIVWSPHTPAIGSNVIKTPENQNINVFHLLFPQMTFYIDLNVGLT